MNVLALTDRRYLRATLETVGEDGDILVSPPLGAADLSPAWFEGYEFLYIDLHGQPGSVYLYTTGGTAALSIDTVRSLTLRPPTVDRRPPVVFLTSCYLDETEFPQAFLEAGARAVIGGSGKNWGGTNRAVGCQRLAKMLIEELEKGQKLGTAFQVELALERAKSRMGLYKWTSRTAVRDAMRFRCWKSVSQ